MQPPAARWLMFAMTLAGACTSATTRVPEQRAEFSALERPPEPTPAPPPAPAPAPTPTPHPGELTRLHIGRGWGCVVDVAGELWCWGRGPLPAPPWQAVRVETPGPVLALGSDQEPGSPASHITCATFKDADARCWDHSLYGGRESWGPFVGTAGALDIAVHAQGGGTGSNFVCVRMPDATAPCFRYFNEDAPEHTLRDVLDLEHVGRMRALTRDGRILNILEPVGEYGQAELRPARSATIRGARSLVAAPFAAPLCALDERSGLRCTHAGRPIQASLVAALRALSGPLRSIGLADEHACAVTGDGAVACAGHNRWGELGSGEPLTDLRRDDAVAIPGLTDVRQVAVTEDQTCVMTARSVRCHGRNAAVDVRQQQSTLDLDARRIMSRSGRTCVVDGGERTWCWGHGVDGAGPRRVHLPIGAPVAIAGPFGECFVDERRSMICGALVPDPAHPGDLRLADADKPRTIAAVGRAGDHAELVRGVLRLRDSLLADPALRRPVTDIGSTWDETCVLASTGEIDCWRRRSGPRGRRIEKYSWAIPDAVALSGPCALRRSGSVSCWSGSTVQDTGLTGALRIVADTQRVCALLPAGRLRCEWLGPLDPDPLPATVLDGKVVDLVASGHWCAVFADGKVLCWGDNYHGELGTLPAGVSLEGREITWAGPSARPAPAPR